MKISSLSWFLNAREIRYRRFWTHERFGIVVGCKKDSVFLLSEGLPEKFGMIVFGLKTDSVSSSLEILFSQTKFFNKSDINSSSSMIFSQTR